MHYVSVQILEVTMNVISKLRELYKRNKKGQWWSLAGLQHVLFPDRCFPADHGRTQGPATLGACPGSPATAPERSPVSEVGKPHSHTPNRCE